MSDCALAASGENLARAARRHIGLAPKRRKANYRARRALARAESVARRRGRNPRARSRKSIGNDIGASIWRAAEGAAATLRYGRSVSRVITSNAYLGVNIKMAGLAPLRHQKRPLTGGIIATKYSINQLSRSIKPAPAQ